MFLKGQSWHYFLLNLWDIDKNHSLVNELTFFADNSFYWEKLEIVTSLPERLRCSSALEEWTKKKKKKQKTNFTMRKMGAVKNGQHFEIILLYTQQNGIWNIPCEIPMRSKYSQLKWKEENKIICMQKGKLLISQSFVNATCYSDCEITHKVFLTTAAWQKDLC